MTLPYHPPCFTGAPARGDAWRYRFHLQHNPQVFP
jgi:hypothetical protein